MTERIAYRCGGGCGKVLGTLHLFAEAALADLVEPGADGRRYHFFELTTQKNPLGNYHLDDDDIFRWTEDASKTYTPRRHANRRVGRGGGYPSDVLRRGFVTVLEWRDLDEVRRFPLLQVECPTCGTITGIDLAMLAVKGGVV